MTPSLAKRATDKATYSYNPQCDKEREASVGQTGRYITARQEDTYKLMIFELSREVHRVLSSYYPMQIPPMLIDH